MIIDIYLPTRANFRQRPFVPGSEMSTAHPLPAPLLSAHGFLRFIIFDIISVYDNHILFCSHNVYNCFLPIAYLNCSDVHKFLVAWISL